MRSDKIVQQPLLEVMNKKRVYYLVAISIFSVIFAMIALLGYSGPEFTYLNYSPRNMCSHADKASQISDYNVSVYEKYERLRKAGLSYDPDCAQIGDTVVWKSDLKNVQPEMWQIFIEAIGSPGEGGATEK